MVLYVIFSVSLLGNIFDYIENDIASENIFAEETTDEILEKYVDVSFGEFKIKNNDYFPETSLSITYYITIEAVDTNGARIETDTIYADRLGAGQEIYLTAFEYVEQDKIDLFKNATFKVLEIDKYSY